MRLKSKIIAIISAILILSNMIPAATAWAAGTAAAPNIVTQPQSTSMTTGSAIGFSVTATAPDGGTLSYQWQKALFGTTTYIDIAGATSSSYTDFTKGDIRSKYRCVVSNTLNGTSATANSVAATLLPNISNTYTVTFRDWDGTVLKTQTVHEGSGATAPGNPLREGYAFNGWDTAYDFIINDLTVTAQYTAVPGSVGTGSITGKVESWDGHQLEEGVDVSMTVDGAVYSATTDTSGSFTLTGVPEGTGYTVTFSKSGYTDETCGVTSVVTGQNTYLGFITLYYPLEISTMNSHAALTGQTVTFKISAIEGKPSYTCQWKRDGVIVATHTVYAGGAVYYGGTDSLTVTASPASRGTYTAMIMDAHGDIVEGSAVLSLISDSTFYRSGFAGPSGIVVDSGGNIIFSTSGALMILKTDGTVAPYIPSRDYIGNMAMDSAGNIYSISGSNITKMSPDGSVTVVPSTGLTLPWGIAVDSAGNVYVTDSNDLKKISPNPSGGYTTTIIAGGFSFPAGVAVDGSGNLYVADSGNNKVEKLAPNDSGSYDVSTWGSGFFKPYGVAVDSAGNVYVADNTNSSVKRINTSGIVDQSWSTNVPDELLGITLDSSGNIYVTGDNANTITKIIPADNTVVDLALGLGAGSGVAVDAGGNIYVADTFATGVSKMIAGGAVDTLISPVGITFSGGIAVDSSGNVYASYYVNSSGSGCIMKVAPDKTVITLVQGLGNGVTTWPKGVAVDGSGYVYTLVGGTVEKISPDGSTVTDFASGFSSLPNCAYGIAVDSSGYVYVADTGNNLVKKLDSAGNVVAVYSGFNGPRAVTVDDIGNIYVADTGNNAVKKISPDGTITVIDNGSFNAPTGIAVDSTGKLYVTDSDMGVKIFQQYSGVIYNGNGNSSGSAPTDGNNYVNGQSATVLGNTGSLGKNGFSFNGWNTKPDGSGTAYAAGDNINLTLPNVTLYAQWNPVPFVAVTGITGVPTTAMPGTDLTLTGTVVPSDATNQTVAWSVYNAGTTGASISGNTLSTTAAGTVTATATIADGASASTDYTQDFTIQVNAAPVIPTLTTITLSGTIPNLTVGQAVYNLNNLSLNGTDQNGDPFSLFERPIQWNLASGNSYANLTGSTLTPVGAGSGTVTASVYGVTSNPLGFAVLAAPTTYTLNYAAGTGGSISGTVIQSVYSGASGTEVTATADSGYHFVSWSDGLTTASRTDSDVTADLSVTANFAADIPLAPVSYTLNYTAGANGSLSGTVTQSVYSGASGMEVTAVPNSGYHFVSWSDGLTTAARTDSHVTASLSVTASFAADTYSGGGGGGNSNTPSPTPTPTTVTGSVVDGTTGSNVSNITAIVTTGSNGNDTISMNAAQLAVLRQPDGTTSPLSDLSKVAITTAAGTPITISADGTVQMADLAKGTDNNYNITYDLGNGQTITIGTLEIKIDSSGNVTLTETLIDPYGIVTDAATGKALAGVDVTLYYANTDRNKAAGKTPNTAVPLPSIAGFKPNNNQDPQTSDANGAYGFMVFPTTDYYIAATKDGYDPYTSPTISVGQEIMHWDFKMSPITSGVTRLAGQSRVDTALAIAKAEYPGKVTNVILATADNYPDALAGSVLAYKLNAPILLVGSSDADQAKVLDYMKSNLDPTGTVYILGGTAVVSSAMENQVEAGGFTHITRLAGADRYETSAKIADQLAVKAGTPLVLVSGDNYPDALSISSVAAQMQLPILLVQNDGISDSVSQEIAVIKPSKVYIIGGEGVIIPSVENQVEQLTGLAQTNIVRIGGADRYVTSLDVAQYFNLAGQNVCVATGNNFPDALAGSVYAANNNASIILADGSLSDQVTNYLKSKNLTRATIFGGEAIVSKGIEQQLGQLIGQ